MTRLAPGWEWSPSGRARLIRDYVEPTRDDPRLQQDMEAELAADVECYDHPTKGRIRLRDELLHPPGALSLDHPPPDELDLNAGLEDMPSDFDDWQPVYDRRADPA